jgi:hypothetical protein
MAEQKTTAFPEGDKIKVALDDYEKRSDEDKSDLPLDLSEFGINGRHANFEAFTEWLSRRQNVTILRTLSSK